MVKVRSKLVDSFSSKFDIILVDFSHEKIMLHFDLCGMLHFSTECILYIPNGGQYSSILP